MGSATPSTIVSLRPAAKGRRFHLLDGLGPMGQTGASVAGMVHQHVETARRRSTCRTSRRTTAGRSAPCEASHTLSPWLLNKEAEPVVSDPGKRFPVALIVNPAFASAAREHAPLSQWMRPTRPYSVSGTRHVNQAVMSACAHPGARNADPGGVSENRQGDARQRCEPANWATGQETVRRPW